MDNITISENITAANVSIGTFVSHGEVILFTILVPVTCLLGVLANVLVMWLIKYRGVWKVHEISFFALSISDTCFVLVSLVYNVVRIIIMSGIQIGKTLLVWYILPWFTLQLTFNAISGFITLFIALERLLAIQFPLKCKTILTRRRVICTLFTILLITSSFNVLGAFTRETEVTKDNTTQNYHVFVVTAKNPVLLVSKPIYSIVNIAGFVVMPNFVTGVINLLTIICLVKFRKSTEGLNRTQGDTVLTSAIKKCKCFLSITTVSFLLNIFKSIYYISVTNGEEVDHMRGWKGFVVIYLTLINSTVNSVLFMILDRDYSEIIKTYLTSCFKTPEVDAPSTNDVRI